MEKIRILAVIPDRYAVGKFRGSQPHDRLVELYGDEFEVTKIQAVDLIDKNFSLFDNYDIVYFSKSFTYDLAKDNVIIDYLKNKGIKTVIDIDDYYRLDAKHNLYRRWKEKKVTETILSNLRRCDHVTTTTDIFREILLKQNPNVTVLPNAVNPEEPQFVPKPTESKRLRFGFICGSSHLQDFELLEGLTNQLPKEIKDNIQFVLCGFDIGIRGQKGKVEDREPTETVWYKYEQILTDKHNATSNEYNRYLHDFVKDYDFLGVENEMYRRYWTLPIDKYATHYNNIDVLMVPLKDSEFTRVKSQLKVVEAGFFKKPIIASNCGPYTIDLKPYIVNGKVTDDGNALLVDSNKNHKMWAKHIKTLVENKDYVKDLGERLYKTVKDEYHLDSVTAKRADLYRNLKAR